MTSFLCGLSLENKRDDRKASEGKKLSHFSHPIFIIVTVLLIRLHKQVTLICV